jgi:hypothetical protein
LKLSMMGGFGYFARIDWAGIVRENFGCCVTNMGERARADSKPRVHQQTGVAQRWRSSAG